MIPHAERKYFCGIAKKQPELRENYSLNKMLIFFSRSLNDPCGRGECITITADKIGEVAELSGGGAIAGAHGTISAVAGTCATPSPWLPARRRCRHLEAARSRTPSYTRRGMCQSSVRSWRAREHGGGANSLLQALLSNGISVSFELCSNDVRSCSCVPSVSMYGALQQLLLHSRMVSH